LSALCCEPGWPDTAEYLEGFVEKAERLHIPLAGTLELTRRCNLDCVHCYLGPRLAREALQDQEMSTARICALIDEMTEAGCMNLLITGGEALLRDDFPEIYRHAKGNGLLVSLFTNGTLVSEEIVALFRALPPVKVEISIYGATAGVYESITRVPGSYDACLRGIRRLLESGTKVALKTVLMTTNSHEFEAMEALARDFGVRFRFDAAISPGIDGDLSPLSLRVSPDEAIAKELSDPRRVERLAKFFSRHRSSTLDGELYGCGAGRTSFYLDPFGRLYPCLMALDSGFDTAVEGFKKVWDACIPSIREKKASPDAACRGCDKINICGYCPGFFRLEQGREDLPSAYLCQMGNLRFQRILDRGQQGDGHGQSERRG
jgi:radical SAM protein with 4Fe4S-binding SPASM domain